MRDYYVYIMANASRSTLYIGVTNGLTKRVLQHRAGETPGFTRSYRCNRLVYFEQFDDPSDAIGREKQLKRWRRDKKDELISTKNPKGEDLAVSVLGLDPALNRPWEER